MSEREKPVCSTCGSANIGVDARATWCDGKQDWELSTTYDNSDCEDCSGECSLDWIPSDDPAVSKWETLARSKGWDTDSRGVIARKGKETYCWSAACAEDNLSEHDFLAEAD